MCRFIYKVYYLPDKAIDLLDQAGSKVKISNLKRPKKAKDLEIKLEKLMEEEDTAPNVVEKSRISEKQDKLFKEYKRVLQKWSDSNSKKEFVVKVEDINELVSSRISVPLEQVLRLLINYLIWKKIYRSIFLGNPKL